MFANDGMKFQNGYYFTHYSSPANTVANTRLFCGQYSQAYTTPRLRTTDYGQITATTPYIFRYPVITNPASRYSPFSYKMRLLSYGNNVHYPTVMGYYEYNGLLLTNTGTVSDVNLYHSISNAVVQSTMTLDITFNSYNPANGA